MYTQKNKSKTQKTSKKLFLISGSVLILAGICLTILECTNTTYLFHKRPVTHETQPNTPTRTANSNTKGETDTTTTPGANTSTPAGGDKTPTTPTNTTPLLDPTGNFVSNHRPADNNADQQAVCVTTPGASCEIIFTMGSQTRSLPPQKTDSGGATYWTWSPASANLNAGSWKVQAKATLGDQIKTAIDATSLEVK